MSIVKRQTWEELPYENSVGPLAELLHDNTHLSPEQSETLARRILALGEPDGYGE